MVALNTPTYIRLREQLRSDIVAGVWALGSHVTLAELATHYEVSQNPVREALLQLQGEGVVAMRMNRGAMIPTVDAKYINSLYKVRGAIQSMLARDAAANATPIASSSRIARRPSSAGPSHVRSSRSNSRSGTANLYFVL